MPPLSTLSPLDGRYHEQLKELQNYFSEMALIRYRLVVEIEYLIDLSLEPGVKELPPFTSEIQSAIRSIYRNFLPEDAAAVKDLEKMTNHDVKAVEYFLREKLKTKNLDKYNEFIHFALTSEDVNNLAYSMMWYDAVSEIYRPLITEVRRQIAAFANEYKDQPLLSLTHGQSATPTTVGKEFAVFAARLDRQIEQLKNHRLLGKFGGATGAWSAHQIAYPEVDWQEFSKKFITKLHLEPNLLTTQIEPHDSLAESYQIIFRINTILLDFCRDVWLYVSRGVLGQKKKEGEVGSSTMPHKINPIHFENAEGNLGLANAYFSHLAEKLPVSRLQRDLSDSTVLRNQGVPLAHSVLAGKNILQGMSRLTLNEQKLNEELDNHWEVLAEAVQTILRKHNVSGAYEKLKELTRGQTITKESLREFIKTLEIPEEDREKLLNLTPHTYIGLANKLVK
ncbi:MAG: adenylosuccinate lyase [Patescibacteria group bacterium]